MTSAPLLLDELGFLMPAQLPCSLVFGVCFWVGWALPSCPPQGFKDRNRSSLPKPRGAQCHGRAQCNVCAARTHPTGLHSRCHHTALHSEPWCQWFPQPGPRLRHRPLPRGCASPGSHPWTKLRVPRHLLGRTQEAPSGTFQKDRLSSPGVRAPNAAGFTGARTGAAPCGQAVGS